MSEWAPDSAIDLLRQQLDTEGYVLIRGLLPVECVTRARARILRQLLFEGVLTSAGSEAAEASDMKSRGPEEQHDKNAKEEKMEQQQEKKEKNDEQNSDIPSDRLSQEWLDEESMVGLMDRQELAREPEVSALLEHERLFAMSARLMGGTAVVTLPFKWLRGVKHGQFTGVHADRVYFQGVRYPMLTSWIPLGEVSPQLGGLAVLPGTHRCAAFSSLRASYGSSQVGTDGLQSGWERELTTDPDLASSRHGLHWHTAHFRPGDVVFFGPWLFHMSTTNSTKDRLRLSCDCRWIRRPDKS